MEYIADTVAIIRHFARAGRMGNRAGQILRNADSGLNTIGISISSMVEILYLSEKNRIPLDFGNAKSRLRNADNYKVTDLDLDIVETSKTIQGLELHDRLIVATALFLNVTILTSDQMIKDADVVSVIWD
jgi:PIN domain nuclease of toxin-antitoxin system